MATRTLRSSKSTRRQPYSAAMSTRKSKATVAPSSSNLSPSRDQHNASSSTLPSAGADLPAQETLRDFLMRLARSRYPHITPRDDLDLAMLVDADFDTNGTAEEFHAFVADEIYDDGLNGRNKAEYMANLRAELKEEMDGPSFVAGTKPSPGQDDIRIRPIPDSAFSLRLWPTGHQALYAWAIDFVRTQTGESVVTPPNFKLSIVADIEAPWLPCSGMTMHPIWYTSGTESANTTPSMHTYLAPSGASCWLSRPGQKDVLFKVPLPKQPVTYGRAHVLDFD